MTWSLTAGSSPSDAGAPSAAGAAERFALLFSCPLTPTSSPRHRRPFAEPTPLATFGSGAGRTGGRVDRGGGGGGTGASRVGAGWFTGELTGGGGTGGAMGETAAGFEPLALGGEGATGGPPCTGGTAEAPVSAAGELR